MGTALKTPLSSAPPRPLTAPLVMAHVGSTVDRRRATAFGLATLAHLAIIGALMWMPVPKPLAIPKITVDLTMLKPAPEPIVEPPPPPPPQVRPVIPDTPPPVIESRAIEDEPPPPPKPKPKLPPKVEPLPPEPLPMPVVTAPPQPAPPITPAPAPVVAGPPPDYFTRLSAHLERQKAYPRAAQQRRQQGVVLLRFAIDRQGRLLAYRIEQGSGFSLLDQEVKDLAQRAAPYPPLPDGMPDSSLEVVVPIRFTLH